MKYTRLNRKSTKKEEKKWNKTNTEKQTFSEEIKQIKKMKWKTEIHANTGRKKKRDIQTDKRRYRF